MTDLTIRDARNTDQDAIRAVTLAAYQEYAAVVSPAFWEGYQQNILAALADIGSAQQLVAEQGSALVGTVLLVPAHAPSRAPDSREAGLSWPEIRLLAVAPAARGQGVGAVLMRECLQRARQAGASAVSLHTTDIMRVAQSMYERMGFQRTPETDFEPVPGFLVKGYRLQFDPALHNSPSPR